MSWLMSLPEEPRERVFELMREIGKEAVAHEKKALDVLGDGSSLPVGAGHFDDLIEWAVREGFLRALRWGHDPYMCSDEAKDEGKLCVEKHNAKRPHQLDWQRWPGAGDAITDRLYDRLMRVL